MDLIRAGLDISVGRWKALLVAFALLSITVMGIEAMSAGAAFGRGDEGLLGIKRDAVMHNGQAAFVVREFQPWSLARESGLQVGDVFIPDHWYDTGRSRAPGEQVGGTIVRDGVSRHVELPTTTRPIEWADKLHFVLNASLCGLGTLLGLAIGFRQADRKTSRALALAFLWWSMNLGRAYAPPHWPQVFVSLMNEAALVPGWYLGLWFAIHYPDGTPTGLRRGLRRVLPLFLMGAVVAVALSVAGEFGRITPDAARAVQAVYIGAAGALMLVAFWDGRRHSSGVLRQRFTWLLGAFALFYMVSYATWLDALFGAGLPYVTLVSVLGSLAMVLGLSYAILRHRVLDMGLAVNRSLVFAAVGMVLLGSFQLLQVVTARLLHFDDPAKAGLLSGVLAVLVVLSYPKVKPRAEWVIDRLFFREWVGREAELARFAADARGFTDASSLATALLGAIDRFTARGGATLYVRAGDGRFERQQGSTAGTPLSAAPQILDADEPLAVALRAGRSVARCDDVHSALPGELAMVMSRQRELEAFVLIGRPRDGSVLRADEVAALRAALQSVGAEWQALRWEGLQRERVRA
jgi:hypothetical protein